MNKKLEFTKHRFARERAERGNVEMVPSASPSETVLAIIEDLLSRVHDGDAHALAETLKITAGIARLTEC